MEKKKLVVLTGSFNPVTKAHRMILENAVKKVNADLGLFVEVSNEYLHSKIIVKKKERRPFILSEDTRAEMISSLTPYYPKLRYGGVELGGESPATVRTLKKIGKEYVNYSLFFSIGADKLHGVGNWNGIEEVLSHLHLIVYPRDGYDIPSIINENPLLAKHCDRIIVLDDIAEAKGISSSLLRKKFFSGEDYSDLMDEGPRKLMAQLSPSSFLEISAEGMIKDTVLYGGKFGGNAARKLVYKENTRLFWDYDESRFGKKEDLVLGTKVYKEEFKVDVDQNYNTSYECKNQDCADLALELIERGYNPAIHNLASNKQPCGGYIDGMGAQEESLCQMSTLSLSLYQFAKPNLKCFKDARVANVPGVYPMDINFGGIYSPNVTFFRNGICEFYSLREKTFSCGVISVASLANRDPNDYADDESKYFNHDGYLNEEGLSIEKNKIRTIYRIAIDNGHDSIVLGAFGCGVYHLIPSEVASLFKEILNEKEFLGKFKLVAFAIYEGKGSARKVVGKNGKFKPFYDLFSSR